MKKLLTAIGFGAQSTDKIEMSGLKIWAEPPESLYLPY
jgi:hypothetical protein